MKNPRFALSRSEVETGVSSDVGPHTPSDRRVLRNASGPFGLASGAAEVLRLKSAAVTRGVGSRASVLQRTRSRAYCVPSFHFYSSRRFLLHVAQREARRVQRKYVECF